MIEYFLCMLNKEDLKKLCRKLKISASGNKEDLYQKILEATDDREEDLEMLFSALDKDRFEGLLKGFFQTDDCMEFEFRGLERAPKSEMECALMDLCNGWTPENSGDVPPSCQQIHCVMVDSWDDYDDDCEEDCEEESLEEEDDCPCCSKPCGDSVPSGKDNWKWNEWWIPQDYGFLFAQEALSNPKVRQLLDKIVQKSRKRRRVNGKVPQNLLIDLAKSYLEQFS